MADSEGGDCVPNYILLLTANLAAFAALLGLKGDFPRILVQEKIIHGTDTSILAVLFEQGLHVWEGVQVELGPLHGHFLEDHVVLRQRACLVCQEELNAAELLGDCRVSGYRVGHVLVGVDQVGVVHFGHVQVDAQTNWDNRREQENEPEEVDVPVVLKAVEEHNHEGHADHEDAEELGQAVDFEIEHADFRHLIRAIHLRSRLLARVNDEREHVTTGRQHSVLPERVLERERLLGLIVVLVIICAEETLEVVDLVVRWVRNQVPLCVLSQALCRVLDGLALGHCHSLAQLPICLAIKLICADEN